MSNDALLDVNEYRRLAKKPFLSNGEWCWINIPKCASKKITKIVAAGWKEVDFQSAQQLKTFAVIRDPYERFLSGINEYKLRRNRKESVGELIETWWDQPGNFDEHLIPQSDFLGGFDDTLLVPIDNIIDTLVEAGIISQLTDQYQSIKKNPTSKFDQLNDFLVNKRELLDEIVHRDYAQDLETWRLFIKSSKNSCNRNP